MAFFGLLLCGVAIYILYRKISFVLKGQVINGELVGFKRSTKGFYGMEGFNYRIRIDYEGEMYIATSLESVISSTGYPSEPMRGYFKVYFKPSSPKYVSIKGKTGVIWLALFVFVVGVIMLIGPIIF